MKQILVQIARWGIAWFAACGMILATPILVAQGTQENAFTKGVELFNQEKYAEALVLFEQVLQVRPSFVYARSYASQCRLALAKGPQQKNDLEARLARVIIPEVNFSDASLGDVLDYLSSRTQEITQGATTVNFIFMGTTELRSETQITLNLRNIPVTEVIKYVAQMSKMTLRYEPNAVVITAPSAPLSAPSTEGGAAGTAQ